MKFTLKDYQDQAVRDLLNQLGKAKRYYKTEGDISSIALTATTGAGKTVMAGAVIEALFGGNDDMNVEPDSTAVVLWFSDDPSLNEQTRFRLMESSDRISHSDLVVVQNTFQRDKFEPGKVYFLNTQKLSKTSLLVRGFVEDPRQMLLDPEMRPDMRSYTIWDTIRNTIEDPNLTLYLVLDEAHKGMGTTDAEARDKSTIVKRLINGQSGVPPIPIVWGISATVERFEAAMRAAEASSNRIPLPRIQVDPAKVQDSGLVKDTILLDIPATAGQFDTVLLRRATQTVIESTSDWAAYAAEQGDSNVVKPLMVVQCPNTPDPALIKNTLDTIAEEWPEFNGQAVAHVFGDHQTLQFGNWLVPYISPERVQEKTHIKVLLAKDAVSTGWDCPRAEVLMSFRPAQDRTHITQLLGRMVRTPLARRVPGNERLNSVSCLLPFFDRVTATHVVKILMGQTGDDGGAGGGAGRKVVIAPKEMTPNPFIPESVWVCFDSLPSQTRPKRVSKPIKRLTALAHALSIDSLREGAGKEAHRNMHAVLEELLARYKERIDAAICDLSQVDGETIVGQLRERQILDRAFSESADDRSIEAAFRSAARLLSPDIARTFVRHVVESGGDSNEEEELLRDAYLKVTALVLVDDVRYDFDKEANKLADQWFSDYAVAIRSLSDERRTVYNDIQGMAELPQKISIVRPKNRIEETKGRDDTGYEFTLPTRKHHLLSDALGEFPIGDLNGWETRVLESEMNRGDFVAWYRNPSRPTDDSLAVSYLEPTGSWSLMRPDFVFFSKDEMENIRASIVDPHGTHLSDALPKLRGLAEYANQFASDFYRVEAVAEIDGKLRVLDLMDLTVRDAVKVAEDAEVLYRSSNARDY